MTLLRKVYSALHRKILMLKRFIFISFKREDLRASTHFSLIDPKQPVYIFFAPEAGVSPHFTTQCILARSLHELGHQVLLVRCFESYQHCLVKESRNISLNGNAIRKADACISCAELGKRMTDAYGLPTIFINELLSGDALNEIKSVVKTMPADASKFQIDGVSFGALCCMDLALLTKQNDLLNATGFAREMLEAYVESSLISYYAMRNILRKFNVKRLMYFNEYSILMGAVEAAKLANVPFIRVSHALHRNSDRSKIILMSDSLAVINYHKCLDRWASWRHLALTSEKVKLISDNQIFRMGAGGYSVYSPKFNASTSSNLFKSLNLSSEKKTLIAYTSSLDEYYSNIHLMSSQKVDLFQKEQPFRDQIDWISSLVDYVEPSSHLQLVVRIHPREGVTAREKVASQHLNELRRLFSGKYQNVKFIWPEEKISSYDLAEIADLALTSWSNITSELVRLSVPTITAFKRVNPFPIDDVVGWAPTPSEYFKLLEATVVANYSINSIVYAYRWTNCAFMASYVDIGDLVPSADYDGLPEFFLPAEAYKIEGVITGEESLQNIELDELISRHGIEALEEEISALKCELRRMIWFLATGEVRKEDYILKLGKLEGSESDSVTLETNGAEVAINLFGRVVKKRSNAIVRISSLIS